MVAIPVRSGVDLQAARRRKLKFDVPAADAATADEEGIQTCSQPVTTPEAESDAPAADVLQRQRSELQQLLEERAAPDEAAVSILQLKSLMRQMTPNYRDQFINETLHAALNFVALSRQQESSLMPPPAAHHYQHDTGHFWAGLPACVDAYQWSLWIQLFCVLCHWRYVWVFSYH